MQRALIVIAFAALAACQAEPPRTAEAPYAADSSPDARGQAGYATDPGYLGQNGGAKGGRGSAATGATGQRLDNLPAGDPSSQQQPVEETPG
jgi:hypothetical protein